MEERRYVPSFAELIDRMNIIQMKIVFSKGTIAAFEDEMEDIKHDIQMYLDTIVKVDAEVIRAIIVLTQSNLEIWKNEDGVRSQTHSAEYETIAKTLLYTHSLNATRCEAKTRIQNLIGGRTDQKINYIGGAWDIKW